MTQTGKTPQVHRHLISPLPQVTTQNVNKMKLDAHSQDQIIAKFHQFVSNYLENKILFEKKEQENGSFLTTCELVPRGHKPLFVPFFHELF